MQSQLDSIPTPGSKPAGNPLDSLISSIPAAAAAGQSPPGDIKSQLDSIPTPGQPRPAPGSPGSGIATGNMPLQERQRLQQQAAHDSQNDTIPPSDVQAPGVAAAESWKAELDSIPTPGAGGPKPAAAHDDRAQVDTGWIGPGGAAAAPAGRPAASNPELKSQLDSIPTPGGGGGSMAGGGAGMKSELDSIPTPGGGGMAGGRMAGGGMAGGGMAGGGMAGGGAGMKSELDSIPTPGGGGMAGGGMNSGAGTGQAPSPTPQASPTAAADDWKSQLDAIPTPKSLTASHDQLPVQSPAAGAGAGPGAGAMTPSASAGAGRWTSDSMERPSYDGAEYNRSRDYESAGAPGGFGMILVIVLFIAIAVLGLQMMNKAPVPDFNQPAQQAAPATTPTTPTTAPTSPGSVPSDALPPHLRTPS